MRLAGLALALAFSLALPVGGQAQGTRTYEGAEAAALRCSNMMALTGVTLHRAGLMGEEEKDVLIGVSLLILERHVSGTWTQKKRAMEVMRDRRDIDETLEDYQRNAAVCLKRFPIN